MNGLKSHVIQLLTLHFVAEVHFKSQVSQIINSVPPTVIAEVAQPLYLILLSSALILTLDLVLLPVYGEL